MSRVSEKSISYTTPLLLPPSSMFHISHKSLSTQALYLLISSSYLRQYQESAQTISNNIPCSLPYASLSLLYLSSILPPSPGSPSTSFWPKLFPFHFSPFLSSILSGLSPFSPSMPLVLYIFLPTYFTTSLPHLLLSIISSGLSLGSATMPIELYGAPLFPSLSLPLPSTLSLISDSSYSSYASHFVSSYLKSPLYLCFSSLHHCCHLLTQLLHPLVSCTTKGLLGALTTHNEFYSIQIIEVYCLF